MRKQTTRIPNNFGSEVQSECFMEMALYRQIILQKKEKNQIISDKREYC